MNPFLKSCLIGTVGILFCQLQSIAQLCTTRELWARKWKIVKFDTAASACLSDNHLLWDVGQQIQVRFLNGTPEQQAKVLALAKEWEKYANIKFVRVDKEPSNMRIKFGTEEENYSLIGLDANLADPAEHTMQLEFALFNDPARLKRVVLHEFGHVLGFMHEHKLPPDGIQWNKDTLYRHFAKMGWDQDMVDAQVFRVYNERYTNNLKYDNKSIMCYPIPSWQTTNGFSVGWNTEISEGDKELAGMIYPFSGPNGNKMPVVKILNYTTTLVKADKAAGGINCFPSFSMQTSVNISELYFTVTLYNKEGYPIMTSEQKFNISGVAGAYKVLRIGPGQKFAVNTANPEEFPLFIPYSSIPNRPENSEIQVLFRIYLRYGGDGKAIFSGSPVSYQVGSR